MFDQVLWFATRGAGAVSQLMLTASVCLGLVTVTRFAHPEWPRFFNYEMHRRISLLSIVFLAIHILAAVFDPFTKLGLAAAIVPLASSYRPVQVALGVVALYLFIALILTSLLRKHIGQRLWRLVHWTSYAMWPLAMAHGFTAGTDGLAPWMLVIDAVCVLAVAASLVWRIQAGTPNRAILPGVVASSSFRMNGSSTSAPDPTRGDRR
jgi:methionine sulfoxide reductase heme-binding subunit